MLLMYLIQTSHHPLHTYPLLYFQLNLYMYQEDLGYVPYAYACDIALIIPFEDISNNM